MITFVVLEKFDLVRMIDQQSNGATIALKYVSQRREISDFINSDRETVKDLCIREITVKNNNSPLNVLTSFTVESATKPA